MTPTLSKEEIAKILKFHNVVNSEGIAEEILALVDTKKLKNQQREQLFKNALQPFLGKYSADELNRFYIYWSEWDIKGKKMKWETEKTWELGKRLVRFRNFKTNGRTESTEQKVGRVGLTDANRFLSEPVSFSDGPGNEQ